MSSESDSSAEPQGVASAIAAPVTRSYGQSQKRRARERRAHGRRGREPVLNTKIKFKRQIIKHRITLSQIELRR